MSSKRYAVIKTDDNLKTRQVGAASKTPAKAEALRQRMRGQQPLGGSASFTIRESRKTR
ncbi:hypothetical protein [Actinoplanes sp. HUAS TT8]|uniref:hypothetical protein n=1 Tax=Actinoplanes sp. HUAS TT8 TaxID=3447453 RepID=UPI003F51CBF9